MEMLPLDANQLSSPHHAFAMGRDEFAREQAGADFEGMFVAMMLKEMRNTLSEGFFGSESSDVFGGMFDQYMGEHIAGATQFGIREMVIAQQSAKLEQSEHTSYGGNSQKEESIEPGSHR